MNNNRLSWLAGVGALSLLTIVCMLLWGFSSKEPDSSSSLPLSSSGTSSVAGVSETEGLPRILSQWEGKLAVFLEGNPMPDEVFDVYIASFPEEEQIRLRQGIRVTNDTELARYLEDYTS